FGTQVDLAVSGTLVYLVSTNGSIDIVDVSNPAAPLRIGGAATALSGPGVHIAVEGSVAVVLSTNTSDYLDVLNISNPALPVRTASVTLGPPGTGKGVTLVAGLAYVAADAIGGLKIYDVGTPTPVGQGSVNDDFAPRAIAVSSGLAVVAGKYIPTLTARLQVLTVANPVSPTVVGELPTTVPVTTSGTGYMGVALNSTGTLAVMALGSTGIWVVDLTNPAAPLRLGGAATALSGPGVHIAVEGSVAAVLSTNASDFLDVLNVSNPALPVRTASVTLGPVGTAKGVTLVGGRAYVASNTLGLQIYDLTTPTAPIAL